MRAWVSFAVGIVVLPFLATAAVGAPFSDGGFESPIVAGQNNFIPNPPGGTIGAWQAYNVDHIGSYWPGYGGSGQSVDLNGTNGAGLIFEAFDTIIGQEYEVAFAVSRNSEGGPAGALQLGAAVFPNLAELYKAVLGQPYTAIFQDEFDTPTDGVTNAKPYSEDLWETYRFRFTATESQSVLVFAGDPDSSHFGPVLDAVSVTPTPEPTSIAVVGIAGLVGAAMSYKRRRVAKEC